MTVRVAYDISTLVRYYYRPNFEQFGISRITEEVLKQLLIRDDVEVTIVRLCEALTGEYTLCSDPLYEALKYYYYLEDSQDWLTCTAEPPFRSRLGFDQLYKSVYTECFSAEFQASSQRSPRAIYLRILRKLLSLLWQRDLYQGLEPGKFDVFHSLYAGFPEKSLTPKVARLITIHDLIPIVATQFVIPGLTGMFQSILNTIDIHRDWAVCVSEYTKQVFCEHMGMSADRVFVTPWAAATHFHPVTDISEIEQVRQRYGIPAGNYFLSLSALQPRKNYVHVMRSFEQLLLQNPTVEVSLVLVGHKGWMYDDILETAAQSEVLKSHVIFTGYVPDYDLSTLYSGATAFIYLSLYEGFGLPPLEAMQCGVPVIASNTTSLPEVVGEGGILIDPTDCDACCQAMMDLLQSPAHVQAWRQKALTRAQQFSWTKTAKQLTTIYQTISRDRE